MADDETKGAPDYLVLDMMQAIRSDVRREVLADFLGLALSEITLDGAPELWSPSDLDVDEPAP